MKYRVKKIVSYLLTLSVLVMDFSFLSINAVTVYADETETESVVNIEDTNEVPTEELIIQDEEELIGAQAEEEQAGAQAEGINDLKIESIDRHPYEENAFKYDVKVTFHTTVLPQNHPLIDEAKFSEQINAENFYRKYSVHITGNYGSLNAGLDYEINSAEGTLSDNKVSITIKDRIWNNTDQARADITILYGVDNKSNRYIDNEEDYLLSNQVGVVVNPLMLDEEAFDENTFAKDNGLAVVFNTTDYYEKGYTGSKIAEDAGNYYFTGKAVKPDIDIYDGNIKLESGKDYKLVYKNNVKVYSDDLTAKYGDNWCVEGKIAKSVKNPYVQIIGKGTYSGITLNKFFNIVPAVVGLPYGIRAYASMKSSRIVTSSKASAPVVNVVIQRWDEKKESYVNLTKLKNKRDYTVTYHKKGETEELSKIPANATGEYIATVSGVNLYKGIEESGKIESAKNSEQRSGNPVNVSKFAHTVSFVINDKDKDLSKAEITVADNAKSQKYTDLDHNRPDKSLKAWQIASADVELKLKDEVIDPTYYEVYVGDNYRGSGDKRALKIVPTLSGTQAGYYGIYNKSKNESYCLLWSDVEITGKDINELDLVYEVWDEEIMDYKQVKIVNNTWDTTYDNDYRSVNRHITYLFMVDGDQRIDVYSDDYLKAKVIESNSGLIGLCKYELSGVGKYSGTREVTINVGLKDGKKISPDDGLVYILFPGIGMPVYEPFVNNTATKEDSVTYNKNIKSDDLYENIVVNINGYDRELVAGKDYILNITVDNNTAVGNATATITFDGIYKDYMEDANLKFKLLPQTNPESMRVKLDKITVKKDITCNELLRKAKISITEKSSKKELVNGEDYEIDSLLYTGTAKTAVADMSAKADPSVAYFLKISGKAGTGYEGLTIYKSVQFNRKLVTKDFKGKTQNVSIAHKGDISYLESGAFLKDLNVGEIGQFGADKDFYIRPYKTDEDGKPDGAYYGSAGNKKVYIEASEGTVKCSGSVLITIKVNKRKTGIKELLDGGYKYLLSKMSDNNNPGGLYD